MTSSRIATPPAGCATFRSRTGGRRSRGFSLIEILIAVVILSVALFGLLVMNRASNRGSMDVAVDFLALQLAREPLEILSGMGYHWLAKPGNVLPDYPYDDWNGIADAARYPLEALQFERRIEREPIAVGGMRAMRIRVTVRPRDGTSARAFTSRPEWVQQVVVPEVPR